MDAKEVAKEWLATPMGSMVTRKAITFTKAHLGAEERAHQRGVDPSRSSNVAKAFAARMAASEMLGTALKVWLAENYPEQANYRLASDVAVDASWILTNERTEG